MICKGCLLDLDINNFGIDLVNGKQYTRKKCNKCRYQQRSNQEHYNKRKEEISKKDYIKRKAYINEHNREYKKTEKGKVSVLNAITRRKRLKEGTDDKTINLKSLKVLMDNQQYKCNICGLDLKNNLYHLDHIFPLCKGGNHSIKNVQYLCVKCNLEKGKK